MITGAVYTPIAKLYSGTNRSSIARMVDELKAHRMNVYYFVCKLCIPLESTD